jgi:hypothetical protein
MSWKAGVRFAWGSGWQQVKVGLIAHPAFDRLDGVILGAELGSRVPLPLFSEDVFDEKGVANALDRDRPESLGMW